MKGLLTMRKFLLCGVCLLSFAVTTDFSVAAQVSPTPQVSVDHNGVATGLAVTVLQAGSSVTSYRVDCTLQNTSTRVMWYAFGVAATTASMQLQPGGVMNCNNGVTVDSQALSLLGSATDTYVLSEKFVAGQ